MLTVWLRLAQALVLRTAMIIGKQVQRSYSGQDPVSGKNRAASSFDIGSPTRGAHLDTTTTISARLPLLLWRVGERRPTLRIQQKLRALQCTSPSPLPSPRSRGEGNVQQHMVVVPRCAPTRALPGRFSRSQRAALNSEALNTETPSLRNTAPRAAGPFRFSGFGFPSDFGFRISVLG